MKALWWDARVGKLEYVTNATEPVVKQPGDVKVKVAFSGVCGSDFHYMSGEMGKHGAKQDGVILGHEFCGTVVEIGSEVKDLKVGDNVAVDPNGVCQTCESCNAGRGDYCEGSKPIGVKVDGGWSEYCVVPARMAYKLPPTVPLNSGALCEPLSCVIRGWNKMKELPDKSSRVLIQGAGVIGSMFACMFHIYGYKNVTMSEPHDGRREAFQKLGLGYRAVIPQTLVDETKEKDPDTNGYDVVYDCTGNCKAVEKCIDFTRRGAFICVFGCCPAKQKIQIEPFQLFWKELKICGSFINTFCFNQAVDVTEDMHKKGLLEYDKMGVKVFDLSQYKEALDSLKSGSAAKAMFKL